MSLVCFPVKFPLHDTKVKLPDYVSRGDVAPPLPNFLVHGSYILVPENSIPSQMGKGGENVQRSPEDIKLGHMNFGELSNTSNTMIHKDILAFCKF